jgi:hypothetical protein
MSASCSECRFKRKNPGDLTGRQMVCAKNPPQVSLVPAGHGQLNTLALWPPVQGADWCGAFETAPPAVVTK